jgi:hypothetical protein
MLERERGAVFLIAGEGRFKCAMEMELAWNIGSNITEI